MLSSFRHKCIQRTSMPCFLSVRTQRQWKTLWVNRVLMMTLLQKNMMFMPVRLHNRRKFTHVVMMMRRFPPIKTVEDALDELRLNDSDISIHIDDDGTESDLNWIENVEDIEDAIIEMMERQAEDRIAVSTFYEFIGHQNVSIRQFRKGALI
ncbi:hypothetical protein D918_01919 [Trichuris suis]|nr:hypothetical protein D918_01919 [Trichuris suis]